MLKIYNSLTKKKEAFKPLVDGKIGMYVCGMTVYDYCHLGHARAFVAFDVIVRYLRARGFDVNYVRNITDIDDKIILRAAENKESFDELTKRMIKAMDEDFARLNMMTPDEVPRATSHIDTILAMISMLLKKGYAYLGDNGDVFFEVAKFPDYGKLAHKDLEGQVAGSRVDVVDIKRNALDFVLWKKAKEGEPFWDSPWGKGRPGWHIECSAMSKCCLGETFDIHGGGFDLQFPHHENEIAQSEAANDKPFANYWMHAGFLQINKEKMSKSLGNFFTIRDVLKTYSAEVVRYFLLASHYRSQLNYSTDNLHAAKASLERLYQSLLDVDSIEKIDKSLFGVWHEKFKLAMDDDFNTPEAIAVLFELSHEINRCKKAQTEKASQLAAVLKRLANVLGLLEQSANTFLQSGLTNDEAAKIEALIKERIAARNTKQWDKADAIRQQLKSQGIELLDSQEGTTWRKV